MRVDQHSMLLVLAAVSGPLLGGCREGTCSITETELSEADLLWGEVVGEEMAMLAGPIEGTWVWAEESDIIDIPAPGSAIPVTAHIQFDPTSYLLIDTQGVPGRRKVFQDRGPLCPLIDGFHAGAVMTFVDENGETVAVAPLRVQRESEAAPYISSMELENEDISIFSDELTPLEHGTSQLLWGSVSHGFHDVDGLVAEFDYVVEHKLPDTPEGHEAAYIGFAEVAKFYVD